MTLFDKYEYQPSEGLIGKTRLTRVYKGIDKTTSLQVAVKIFRNNDSVDGIAVPENDKLLTLKHANLCSYELISEIDHENAFGEKESLLVCVREYVEGNDLASWYRSAQNTEELKLVLAGFLRALQFLHDNGIIHRRIKTTNLLIASDSGNPTAKLMDFGLEQKNTAVEITANVDYWALGLTLYETITGDIQTDVAPEKLSGLPHPFDRIASRCLVRDAALHVKDASELLELLEPASEDTQILPPSADDTQILPPTSDDTRILPPTADDTQILEPSTDDTVILTAPSQRRNPDPPMPPPPSARGDTTHLLLNRYEYSPRVDLIGKGGFSKVYRAFDRRLNRWVALKIYTPADLADQYSPIAEIRRVINLDHPNICRYIDIEEIEREDNLRGKETVQICVMELLNGGNIAEYYKANPSPTTLRKLLNDVLSGLGYLHRNGIIHRDIKPANILIRETSDGPVAKITDFGISKLSDNASNQNFSAIVGSVPYMAPELLNVRKYGIKQAATFNLDFWALGVTIYEVMTGKALFKNSDQESGEQIMSNILAGAPAEKLDELPQPFRDLVARCCTMEATHRPQKAGEFIAMLDSSLPVSEPQPEKRRPEFIVEEAEAKPSKKPAKQKLPPQSPQVPEQEEEGERPGPVRRHLRRPLDRRLLWLGLAIAAAAIFLGISVWMYVQNRQTQNTTASAQRVDSSASIVDKPGNNAPPIASSQPTAGGADSSLTKIARKKPRHTTPAVSDDQPGRDNGNTVSTYILKLTASADCNVKIDDIPRPSLPMDKIMKVPLQEGVHIIEATGTTNNKLVFRRKLTVKQEMLGTVGNYNMTLELEQ